MLERKQIGLVIGKLGIYISTEIVVVTKKGIKDGSCSRVIEDLLWQRISDNSLIRDTNDCRVERNCSCGDKV